MLFRSIADIAIIQQALELYHRDEGFYPSSLISGQVLRGSSTNNIYLASVPKAPTPNDGTCSSTANLYNYTFISDDEYRLSYCLGDDTGKTVKGEHCATDQAFIGQAACPTPAFSPASIAGLNLWFSADYGITKDTNNKISSWLDRSGNANNANQATTDDKPSIIVDNNFNNRSVLSFDGNDGLFFNYPLSLSKWSIFSVIKYISGSRFPLISNDLLRQGLVLESGQFYTFGAGQDLSIGYTAPTSYKIISSIYDGATNNIYENGNLVGGSSGATSMNVDNIGLYLYSNAVGNYAETIVYNNNLNTDNRKAVEDYLNSKYNLY